MRPARNEGTRDGESRESLTFHRRSDVFAVPDTGTARNSRLIKFADRRLRRKPTSAESRTLRNRTAAKGAESRLGERSMLPRSTNATASTEEISSEAPHPRPSPRFAGRGSKRRRLSPPRSPVGERPGQLSARARTAGVRLAVSDGQRREITAVFAGTVRAEPGGPKRRTPDNEQGQGHGHSSQADGFRDAGSHLGDVGSRRALDRRRRHRARSRALPDSHQRQLPPSQGRAARVPARRQRRGRPRAPGGIAVGRGAGRRGRTGRRRKTASPPPRSASRARRRSRRSAWSGGWRSWARWAPTRPSSACSAPSSASSARSPS